MKWFTNYWNSSGAMILRKKIDETNCCSITLTS